MRESIAEKFTVNSGLDSRSLTVRGESRRSRCVRLLTGMILSALLIAGIISPATPVCAAVTGVPELIAQSAVLINADTGEVLYDKYKDYPHYPAVLRRS